MTRDEARRALQQLNPAQRRMVLEAALALRMARLAGDKRPPAAIIAPILTLTRRTEH